jgi:molybdenum cofactor biosynthesis enzyme MoaA
MFFIGVHGEPLLDKRLAEKVAQCKSKGLNNVLVSTNGSLLSEPRARELLQAAPHIVTVSLESMDPATFETIRKSLIHQEVVGNLKSLFSIRNEVGSTTRIAIRYSKRS